MPASRSVRSFGGTALPGIPSYSTAIPGYRRWNPSVSASRVSAVAGPLRTSEPSRLAAATIPSHSDPELGAEPVVGSVELPRGAEQARKAMAISRSQRGEPIMPGPAARPATGARTPTSPRSGLLLAPPSVLPVSYRQGPLRPRTVVVIGGRIVHRPAWPPAGLQWAATFGAPA